MKPPEILSMIEEAAGTRMFEERKEKALKTIAKKEKKVGEITQLLSEEIVPKLDKLRSEKRAYLEFQKTQTEIERLSRIVTSFDYSRYEVRLEGYYWKEQGSWPDSSTEQLADILHSRSMHLL